MKFAMGRVTGRTASGPLFEANPAGMELLRHLMYTFGMLREASEPPSDGEPIGGVIPHHNLSSNDEWWTEPEEIEAALSAYARTDQSLKEAALDDLLQPPVPIPVVHDVVIVSPSVASDGAERDQMKPGQTPDRPRCVSRSPWDVAYRSEAGSRDSPRPRAHSRSTELGPALPPPG